MANLDTFHSAWRPRVLSVLRIITGFMFIAHGTQKLFNYPQSQGGGPTPLFSFMGFGGTLELVGGSLILLGLFTRVTAFILCGMMAVAYFMVRAPLGFYPLLNNGRLDALLCFVFLYFVFAGPGAWSLDAIWRSRGLAVRSEAI